MSSVPVWKGLPGRLGALFLLSSLVFLAAIAAVALYSFSEVRGVQTHYEEALSTRGLSDNIGEARSLLLREALLWHDAQSSPADHATALQASRREVSAQFLKTLTALRNQSTAASKGGLMPRIDAAREELLQIYESPSEPAVSREALVRAQQLRAVIEESLNGLGEDGAPADTSSGGLPLRLAAIGGIATAVALFVALFCLTRLLSLATRVAQTTQTLENRSERFAQAASSLTQSVTQLCSVSLQQSGAVAEASTLFSTMTSGVLNVSRGIQSAEEDGHGILRETEDGCQMMERMVESMRGIEDLGQKLDVVAGIIQGISRKTDIIHEIVSTTKLLSLNASIEAARAGDYGRGFAIVAEEVGNLAQMSDSAAREISALIDSSRKEVDAITTEASASVKATLEISGGMREHLEHISQGLRRMSEHLHGVSDIARSQETSIERGNVAIGRFHEASTSTRNLGEAVTAGSTECRHVLDELSESVRHLRRLVSGKS